MRHRTAIYLSIALIALCGGCATTAKSKTSKPTDKLASLAEIVADVAEGNKGNLVIMNGIQDRVVPVPEMGKKDFKSVAESLAAASGYSIESTPYYNFLYPSEYSALLTLSLQGKLDPKYEALKVPVTLGFDTPIYGALALISQSLNITVVADQIVGGAMTGAMTFTKIPLQNALEALLKSARVANGAFDVELTPDYIFFYAKQNPPHPTLLNKESLNADHAAKLDQRVDVSLPQALKDEKEFTLSYSAKPLAEILTPLSEQIKIKVSAAPELKNLPVNACIFNQVSVRTAMDLLIRQWPRNQYGYEFTSEEIVIKTQNK